MCPAPHPLFSCILLVVLQAQGLGHLAEAMEGQFPAKFQRMTQELCEVRRLVALFGGFVIASYLRYLLSWLSFKFQRMTLELPAVRPSLTHPPNTALQTTCTQVIEDFGLLSFQPLAIEDRDSVRHLAAQIDKANGYVFSGLAKPGGWVGEGVGGTVGLGQAGF